MKARERSEGSYDRSGSVEKGSRLRDLRGDASRAMQEELRKSPIESDAENSSG